MGDVKIELAEIVNGTSGSGQHETWDLFFFMYLSRKIQHRLFNIENVDT